MKEVKISTSILGILCLAWAINAFSQTSDAHFNKARELLNTWRYREAADEFKEIIKLAPIGSKVEQNAKYWVGQCYFRAGQFDQALSTFEKLIEEYPESAIIPATQIMISQVQQAKENEKLKRTISETSEKGVIIDPKTGVKYIRTKTFTGKRDVITGVANSLSPNGKFLLAGKLVIPLDNGDPFDLVDMPAGSGSLSPDGKRVIFKSGGGIWVISVSPETGRATGPAKKLLDGHYWTMPKASWSPDSEKIVFERRKKGGRGDIWALSVKDGSLTQITNDPVWEGWPVWSPDGKTIAYERLNETWVIPAKGGIARKISSDKARVISWSPDSEWLILRLLTRHSKIRFFRLADDREFDMTLPPAEVGTHFAWSPDGKKMLFYKSSYDYKSSLKVLSTSGGPSFELGSQIKLWPYTQFWSHDSRMIVTEGPTKDGDIVLWIIPLADGVPFQLKLDISVSGRPVLFSLSPDRRKLCFSVKRNDNTKDLWVVPVSVKEGRTTGPAVMVFSGSGDWEWSPDGSKIAVIHKDDIWIASADGGEPVQITKTPERKFNPDWLPGEEMISYVAYQSQQEEQPLMVISASGGEPRKLFDVPKGYAWSPNNRELAFESDGFIMAVPIAGGEPRQIADKKELRVDEINYGICWSPDGKKLAFASYNRVTGKPGPGPIFIVSAESGEVTRLATDDSGQKDYLYWSPDGKWISYNSDDGMVKTRPDGSLWEADFKQILEKLLN